MLPLLYTSKIFGLLLYTSKIFGLLSYTSRDYSVGIEWPIPGFTNCLIVTFFCILHYIKILTVTNLLSKSLFEGFEQHQHFKLCITWELYFESHHNQQYPYYRHKSDYSAQDEKNQLLTTNVWLNLVRIEPDDDNVISQLIENPKLDNILARSL